MSMPDTPAHDRENPASGPTPPGGEAEPRALSSGGKENSGSAPPRNGKKVPSIGKFDWDSLVFGTKPAGRSDWEELVSGERPPQVGGAGRLTRLILIGYLLPLLTFGALTAIDISRMTLRMPEVLVCFGPACILALWGLWSARREDNVGAAAHARALLLSLLYGVDACLLRILAVESDPGPAGPVESAGFLQVLMFIIEIPARLFSRLCEYTAFVLGCWIVLRVVMGCTTLLQQKGPGQLVRARMASFMAGTWLLGISLFSLAMLRGVL